MARVSISLPETFPFATYLKVRITDTNHGGHLGNDRVLSLCDEARQRYLDSLGLQTLDIGGVGIIIADAAVVYRAEAFAGDCLRIDVAAAEPGRRGCDLLYRLSRKTDSKEIARVKTGMVCFDYQTRRIAPLPATFRERAGLEAV